MPKKQKVETPIPEMPPRIEADHYTRNMQGSNAADAHCLVAAVCLACGTQRKILANLWSKQAFFQIGANVSSKCESEACHGEHRLMRLIESWPKAETEIDVNKFDSNGRLKEFV